MHTPLPSTLHGKFAFAIWAFLQFGSAWSATTYYVAPNGNDTNEGSLAAPLLTILKAMNTAVAGDTVLIRGGTYREQVDVKKGGGTAGNPVTVSSYGSEKAVIKGSDVVTGWVKHSAKVWKKTAWKINSQQVFVDFDAKPGKPLQQIGMPSADFTSFEYNAPVGTGLSSMTAGTFFYDAPTATLYVWLADSSDPNKHVMEVSTRMRLFFMETPYIILKGLTFRHSNGTGFAQQGAAVELSSNSIIQDCDIQWTDFGGLEMGYLQNNTQAINNTLNNNGSTGISAAGTTDFKISQNRMNYNNYRKFNPLWHAGGFKGNSKAFGVVEANEVAYNYGSGIWCDYCNGGGQIVIRNNYVHDNAPKDSGIFLEVSKNALVYNNVLINNERRGIYISASDGNQVMNNTIVGTKTWAALEVNGMPRDGATLTNNAVYNNIISGNTTQYDLRIAPPDGTAIANNQSNNNNIYRSGQQLALASANFVTSLEAWRTDTGFDLNSITKDPSFVGTGSAAAYSVRDGSPVIDAGMDLSGIVAADYSASARPQGAAYDMGAFEKGGSSTPPPPPPGLDTTGPAVTLGTLTPAPTGGSTRIDATATDNVGVTGMALYIDGVQKATSPGNQISYTWNLAGVASGNHAVRATANDAAQNSGEASGSLTVQEAGTTPPPGESDSVPPVVTISQPANGARATGSVVISATASDNTAVTEMSILVDGTVKQTSTSGSISYMWSITGARNGNHPIRVTATDAAKNTGVANTSVNVR